MQERSSIFAKGVYRDRKCLINSLKEFLTELKRLPEVKRVILFGSIVRGDYGLRSDADVLVILNKSRYKRFFDRIPRYLSIIDPPIPVDIFPFTIEEIKRNKIATHALKNGIEL